MRRTFLALSASLAFFAAGSLMTTRAEAMTFAMPTAVAVAVDDGSLAQDVAYVCRRVWRCGYWGCGWRRVCHWVRGRPYWRRW